jgi:hypothetical protein
MTEITTVVDTYLAALTEADPAARTDQVKTAWADDAHFVDPLLEATGHDAIAALTDAVTGQFPGHTFRRTTGIDAHHDLVRFAWELAGPDGTVAATGLDVAVVAPDGRLARVAGFFGDPPAREG